MLKLWIPLCVCCCLLIFGMCAFSNSSDSHKPGTAAIPGALSNKADVLFQRILPPEGFIRKDADSNSFAGYLRNLPLKPEGARVKYYNGETKSANVYCAVIDMPVGNKDLQQCADATIRLRAEYLYRQKRYNEIAFHFTSGFICSYSKWKEGYRVSVKGNNVNWVKTATADNSYKTFWQYLETVFSYAGTRSLPSDMDRVQVKDIRPGDVFLTSGSPGHAVMVLDVATDTMTGKKKMLLGQSYMPAQDIQVLKNHSNPWFDVEEQASVLSTPEWVFDPVLLYRFKK